MSVKNAAISAVLTLPTTVMLVPPATNRVRSEVPGSTLILMRSRPGEMMMLENRSKTFHLSMHIDSFIAQTRYPDDYQNLMVQEGRDLTPAEARTFFALEKAKR